MWYFYKIKLADDRLGQILEFKVASDKEESKSGDLQVEERDGSNGRFRSKNSEREKSLNNESEERAPRRELFN